MLIMWMKQNPKYVSTRVMEHHVECVWNLDLSLGVVMCRKFSSPKSRI